MFKKLKDKIAEEVKSSPQRIQQIAQAVVSSASSTSSEVSGNDTFFSIAEEDTPRNSPQHTNATNTTSVTYTKTPINSSVANASLNGNPPVRRKLSNSSIGSDVSFRLPSYESPAIYHLQSDLDISASEVEDHSLPLGQLDRVSKDQLHQAYRKSLDKYQKYRRRYTDLARKYSELERENSKARSVLVETQDKALRRISELREQCSLEQQAKAHLEAALRMELDDKDCLIQSLKTKLESEFDDSLMSLSNRSSVDRLQQRFQNQEEEDNTGALIDLTTSPPTQNNNNQNAYSDSLDSIDNSDCRRLEEELSRCKDDLAKQVEANGVLEKEIQKYTNEMTENIKDLRRQLEQKATDLSEMKMNFDAKCMETDHYRTLLKDFENKLSSRDEELKKLKACEEENVLLMAETKQDMHKELERREAEVAALTKKLGELEKSAKDALALNDKFIELETLLGREKKEYDGKIRDLTKRCDESVERVVILEKEKNELISEVKEKDEKINSCTQELDNLRKDLVEAETASSKSTKELNELRNKITSMDWSIKQLETERIALVQKCDLLSKENEILTDSKEKLKQVADALRGELEQSRNDAEATAKQLRQELERERTCSERMEGENSSKLQTELRNTRERLLEAEKVCQDLQQNRALLETELANRDFEVQNVRAAVMILQEALNASEDSDDEPKIERVYKQDDKIEKCSLRELEDRIIDAINTAKQKSDRAKQIRAHATRHEESLGNDLEKLTVRLRASEDECETLSNEVATLREGIESCKLENERITEKSNKAEATVAQLTEELQESVRRIEEIKTELTASSEKLTEALSELDRLQKQNDSLTTERNTLKETTAVEIRDALEKNAELEARLKATIGQLTQDEEKLNEKNEVQGTLEDELKKTTDELSQARNEVEMYKARVQTWEQSEAEKDYMNTVIVQLESDLSTASNKKADLETKLGEMRNDVEAKVRSVNTLSHELRKQKDRFDKRIQHLEMSLEDKVHDNAGLTKTLRGLEEEASEMRNAIEDLTGKLRGAETTNAGLLQQVETLTTEKARLTNTAGGKIETLQHANRQQSEKLVELQILREKLRDYEEKYSGYEKILQENESLKRSLADTDRACVATDSTDAELTVQINALQDCICKLKEDKNYLNKMLSDMELQNASKDEELQRVRADLKAMEIILQDQNMMQNKLDDLESENKKQGQEIHEQLSTENKMLKDKLEECTKGLSEMSVLKGNYEKYEQENKELSDKLKSIEIKYNDVERSIESKISNLNQEIDCHIERIKYLEDKCKDYDSVKAMNVELNKETQNLTKRISQYELGSVNDVGGTNHMCEKKDLEEKLSRILAEVSEVSDRNLVLEQKCNNLHVLEATNEKLKLANEKLSRQLDETLVTRRHSESITQLTEFEYLRNILYQYLSGGMNDVNTNSTLIRVIAAVMKFDSIQTQTVLDKEAQKNTLLGQLHLI